MYKGPWDIIEGTRDLTKAINIFIAASSYDYSLYFVRGQVVRFWPEKKLYLEQFGGYDDQNQTVEYIVGLQTPIAVFVSVEITLVTFKEISSTDIFVFQNNMNHIIDLDEEYQLWSRYFFCYLKPSTKYKKLHIEVEIKIHQYTNGNDLTYVSVTTNRNIYVQLPLA